MLKRGLPISLVWVKARQNQEHSPSGCRPWLGNIYAFKTSLLTISNSKRVKELPLACVYHRCVKSIRAVLGLVARPLSTPFHRISGPYRSLCLKKKIMLFLKDQCQASRANYHHSAIILLVCLACFIVCINV